MSADSASTMESEVAATSGSPVKKTTSATIPVEPVENGDCTATTNGTKGEPSKTSPQKDETTNGTKGETSKSSSQKDER